MVLVLLLAVAGMLHAPVALSQAQNTGSIFGTVTDPSGAVIANATVTVAESAKGVHREAKTSKTGEYNLSSLPVGTYVLTVDAGGFSTFVADAITVDADKDVKIVAKMVVGDKGTTVQVDAEGTAVDTRSATIATLIDNKLVEDVPVDGRNVVALAGLLPGVTDLNAPATNTNDRSGPTFSVSGSRNTQNLFLFDGLFWNNLFFNTGINYPPPNGLQEISVLLNNFKAQYGRNAGSVFNVVTKSGNNQIHGAAWEYYQNSILNAADYLTHINPQDDSNQFGFTVGGPIKKDRAFYEITYQRLQQALQTTGSAIFAQGLAERGFSADGMTPRPCTPGPYASGTTCASYAAEITSTVNGATSYAKLYNPEIFSSSSGLQASSSDAISMINAASLQAGGPANSPCNALLVQAASYANSHNYLDGKIEADYLPNAEIPTQCLNPVLYGRNITGYSKSGNSLANTGLLNTFLPLPNGLTSKGQPETTSQAGQPKHDNNALIRIDFNASARHTLDARYNLIDSDDATASGVGSNSQGVPGYVLSADHAVSNYGNIGDTWVVTTNTLNVFRIGYKRYVLDNPPLTNLTLNDFGGNFTEAGVPTLPSINDSGAYRLGSTSQGNSHVINENIEILEQLSYQHGNHSYQVGANFLRLQYLNRQDYPGSLAFSTTFTGASTADEAFGLLTSVQANSPLVQGGISHSIFTYAQDDWRISPKLTLNLGVRYELPFQWFQPNGYSSTFVPGHQSTVFPQAIGGLAYPGDPGVLKSLVPTDFNGIVPRVGFAYDVFGTGKLAVRGGFGMFFDAINADVVGDGEPFYFQLFRQLPQGGFSVPLAGFGQNKADTSLIGNTLTIPSGYNKANPQFFAPYSLFYPDRNFRTPYYEAYNLGFQVHVTRSGVLDTNYVGKVGRKQTIPVDQNPAITDCTGGYYQSNPTLYGNPSCMATAGTPNGLASSQVTSTQARLRYTPFNYGGSGLVDFISLGTSNYNGLQMQYTQRGGRLLTLLASYTFAKSFDLQTQSQSVSNSIPNVFNVASEHGLSDYDARHIFNMGWVLRFPQITSGFAPARAILNGWQYSGKFITHSGRPYSVTINNDSALDAEPGQRASIVPGMSPALPKSRHRIDKVNEYFNVYAFTYPTVGTFSNVPRNAFIGPGYIQTDMSMAREFPLGRIREGMRLLFRAEAFNVFNTPNLANPSAGFSCTSTTINGGPCAGAPLNPTITSTTNVPALSPTSTFGQVLSTFGNNANTSTNGRKMQFSGTVYF